MNNKTRQISNSTNNIFTRLIIAIVFSLASATTQAGTYYVATNGNNSTGNGSLGAPWLTISHAVNQIPDDGSTIIVRDGVYYGSYSIGRSFTTWMNIKAENPYKARLTNSNTGSVRILYMTGSKIIFEGFEIYNRGPIPPDLSSRGEYLIHITSTAHDIRFKNCILHDNYINDMVKINSGARKIIFESNVCYNQGRDLAYASPRGFQHMDINKVDSVDVQDCIFFNNYPNDGNSKTCNGSFIVCKNSSATFNNHDNSFKRNIFLNWQGPSDQPMLLFGEDAHAPNFDLENGLVENCLFIGNSTIPASGAFNIKGCKNTTFRANTVVGNLPVGSWAYAARVTQEVGEPKVDGAFFYNNIWDDSTGTMTDFSMGNDTSSINVSWRNNLYWNGGSAIPQTGSTAHWANINSDTNHIFADPQIYSNQSNLVLPVWDTTTNKFISGNTTIRDEFVRLVTTYGKLPSGSPAIGAAELINMPADDILGNTRSGTRDVGCYEYSVSSGTDMLNKTNAHSLMVYPNPFKQSFTLAFTTTSSTIISVEIFDIVGKKIFAEQQSGIAGEYKQDISLRYYPKGVYILQLKTGTDIFNEKIVKE